MSDKRSINRVLELRACNAVHEVDRGHHDERVGLRFGTLSGEAPEPGVDLIHDEGQQRCLCMTRHVLGSGRISSRRIGKTFGEFNRTGVASELTFLFILGDEGPVMT